MAKWIKPLIRISTYSVEVIQKRLSEVVMKRTQIEVRIATLDAELEIEALKAQQDHALNLHMPAYKLGWTMRRNACINDLSLIGFEEDGIRDELSHAFEDLKKFEHLAEVNRLKRLATQSRLENAEFDEAASRRKPNQTHSRRAS